MENTCQTDAEQFLTKKNTCQTDAEQTLTKKNTLLTDAEQFLTKEHPPSGSAGTIRKEQIELIICRRYFSYAWGTFAEALWQST